jgi:hypothetical protein
MFEDIKTDLSEIVFEDVKYTSIQEAQGAVQWQAFVKTMMNQQVP